jgi:hypothetical protein
MKSLCDFTTWSRENLESVADEMLALIVEHNLSLEACLPWTPILWQFLDTCGRWQASVRCGESGTRQDFLIDVTEDGQFSVNNSDEAFLCGNKPPHFSTLGAAKTWCISRLANKR